MNIPADIIEHMNAEAFESLCEHLRARSDLVQNMTLMTISGFCRNCLAKWMVLEARKLSKQLRSDDKLTDRYIQEGEKCLDIANKLNNWGYEDAAKIVYGCTYAEWKNRHQSKATEEQLRLYNESKTLHATHDATLLKCDDDEYQRQTELSQAILTRLKAGAFESLCEHLRARSDLVPNMELMTISGFCRNCLAKWLVVEARHISNQIVSNEVVNLYLSENQRNIVDTLDSFGYDEAAQLVYGCTYPEWKKRHMKKATDEQLERYNASKSLHATHNKELLATRSQKVNYQHETATTKPSQAAAAQICVPNQQNSLLSDVCCQEVDAIAPSAAETKPLSGHKVLRPPTGSTKLTIGILTVSDRAAANAYESGDLSGPMVESTIRRIIDSFNASFKDQDLIVNNFVKDIVPDEKAQIEEMLLRWSGKASRQGDSSNVCNLIFTTGGTGFSPRDVTPEATISILDRECRGLMSWASIELTSKQPLATLSRAAAGVCGKTIIINLPGNPAGAAQVAELLFPIILHAIED
ncbi:molybdopterin adenylyltransferase [Skeletonema marinoi]|uniref:Molybdopterin adenylyltransferase n=1 Tax=Skeletonema marinoi TaxID=267567 RepID=A0AAD8XWM7_9STRA|nr:molybdopterin adenylyltransferase [Skeletonema marinoi]